MNKHTHTHIYIYIDNTYIYICMHIEAQGACNLETTRPGVPSHENALRGLMGLVSQLITQGFSSFWSNQKMLETG